MENDEILKSPLRIKNHDLFFKHLDTLAGAFRINPRNPQALYQRATIFMALERPREALAELEKVRDATFLNGESVKKAWDRRCEPSLRRWI